MEVKAKVHAVYRLSLAGFWFELVRVSLELVSTFQPTVHSKYMFVSNFYRIQRPSCQCKTCPRTA